MASLFDKRADLQLCRESMPDARLAELHAQAVASDKDYSDIFEIDAIELAAILEELATRRRDSDG